MAFDIIRFCQDYGIEYATRGKIISKGWVGLPDVFNKSCDKDFHLGFNVSGSYLHSWVDGGHSIKSWLEIVAPDADYHKIMQEYGDEISYVNRLNDKVENATYLEFNFPELPSHARKYIEKRRFNPDALIEKYGLRWGGIVGDFAYRIIIPVYDATGKMVSYQGRFIGKDCSEIPRYKNLSLEKSLVDPKSILFNENNVVGDTVFVVEGFFNCVRWSGNAVASLGTSFTESQVQALSKYKRCVILFDSEYAAQKKAKKLGVRVSSMGGAEVEVIDLELVDRDIAECTDEEIKEFRKQIG